MTYGQFAAGVKLGYNANKLSTNLDTVKSQFKSGFHVGIWTRFGKRFYVAPELQYTMSGAVFSNEGKLSTNNWKQKITIGSLDIPVILGVKIIHSDVITWRVELGPQASFVVNKKVEDENSVLGPIKESSLSSVGWSVLGGSYGNVIAVSSNKDKTLSMITFPGVTANDLKKGADFEGYEGHDLYEIKDNSLVRTFPVKTRKAGQHKIIYDLKAGEASYILVIRKLKTK
ncbi:MAG: porin family protein [Bacteroidota bacterium]